MKALITPHLVETLRKQGLRQEVWDTKLPNFYLQVRESGSSSYYIRYSLANSKVKQTYLLGESAVLSVTQARALAKELLARTLLGGDPAEDKRQARACPTLQEVADERYLPYIKQRKKSWDTDDSMLRCHILPALGKKALSAITTQDIEKLMRSMLEGGKIGAPKGRGKTKPVTSTSDSTGYAPATCNRVAVLLRYLFNLSIDTWMLPGVSKNPAKKVQLYPENNIRQVFLSPEEVGVLVQAGAPKAGQQNLSTLKIVMFLVLTGVRKANAFNAKWDEIDEVRGLWHIPMTKSGKPQNLQLSEEVLTLLKTLPSRGESDYLFPNPRTSKPFVSIYYSWNTMRCAAGMPKLRMHDLRHTFASLLINGGASLYAVQHLLGHCSPQMTGRYAHLSAQTQRIAIQQAGTLLSGFLPLSSSTYQPQQLRA